jgi:hypothetical protein
MAVQTLTARKKSLLNKMNRSAELAGLGDLVSNNVMAAGLFTTVGGDATESITVTGAAAGDVVLVTVNTVGATPRTVTSAIAATNAITVTLSGDPSTDHVLNYVVIRVV